MAMEWFCDGLGFFAFVREASQRQENSIDGGNGR